MLVLLSIKYRAIVTRAIFELRSYAYELPIAVMYNLKIQNDSVDVQGMLPWSIFEKTLFPLSSKMFVPVQINSKFSHLKKYLSRRSIYSKWSQSLKRPSKSLPNQFQIVRKIYCEVFSSKIQNYANNSEFVKPNK